jgi:MFS family permease
VSSDVQFGTIRTRIPARLDRLPWSKFHWRIVIGLGTVWILDGLEVTIVGSIASRLTEKGSGIGMTAADIGLAAAIYVTGACIGALFFGQLTDRFGRKKLFMVTLGVYLLATVATAFAAAPLYFFICRFFTGAGIGGEYAAINSAIDELIPARNRGQVDLTINGSYWVGSAIGGLAALLFLDTAIFAADFGWRLSFAIGGILGIGILIVRRHVPESPRWLFIHGQEEEAERIVNSIEADVRQEMDGDLPPADKEITVRQRKAIPFREIAKVAVKFYPKRAILGLALFIGQAFLYNAVTFDLGTILSTFFHVASGTVPIFVLIFAIGNFLGPLLLGRLFDTVGRKPMIAGTYLVSAALTAFLAFLLLGDSLTRWSFIAVVGITFFFASAGASSAYLTVSEVFPMETRALAIAFFYAIGTAVGGITGPLVFGKLIHSGHSSTVAIGFFIGAAVMAVGGIVELIYGVRAEQAPLEDIAKPLTVADAEQAEAAPAAAEAPAPDDVNPEHRAELECRQRAEEERARAAEHRAASHELRAQADGGDRRAADRLRAEDVLAEISELRAAAFDERAGAHAERAKSPDSGDEAEGRAAVERAEAAEERARMNDERAEALAAEHHADAEVHAELAEAAAERARAKEQRALAEEARAQAEPASDADADVLRAQAELHDTWAQMHSARADAHLSQAQGNRDEADQHNREAAAEEELGRAAEQRVEAARHRAAAAGIRSEQGAVEQTQHEREQAAERERLAGEREQRIRERIARQRDRERQGLRRFRPGPGSDYYSPGMLGTSSRSTPGLDEDLDHEIETIARALNERGATERDDLAAAVGARYWGPGRFRQALREAVGEGRARRLSRNTYAPPEHDASHAPR